MALNQRVRQFLKNGADFVLSLLPDSDATHNDFSLRFITHHFKRLSQISADRMERSDHPKLFGWTDRGRVYRQRFARCCCRLVGGSVLQLHRRLYDLHTFPIPELKRLADRCVVGLP